MRILYESILLLPCFACLFWIVTLLCSYKKNHRLQDCWIAPMGMICISAFVWNIYLFENADYYLCYKLDIIETFSTLSFYPLFYYYLKFLIDNERLRWWDVLWLLPIVMICVWNLFFYEIAGNQEAARYMCKVFYSFSHSIFISFILVAWGVIVYSVGYDIHKMKKNRGKQITAGCTNQLLSESAENGSEELTYRTAQLLATFQQMIDEEKIYLQSDLRLEDLAGLMNTNRTYLSRLINEEFRCTFSDYFNGKRIEYAQDLMFRFPLLTQEEIAKQSGFAYSSSFSRTFRQQTGITFREWRKKNLIEH